jgi:uncharacterized protein (TIGR00369 family)
MAEDAGNPAGPDQLGTLGAEDGFGLVGPDLWNVTPEERLARWNRAPYFTFMGLELVEAEGGRARAVLEIQDHHRGGGGTAAVNGGVIAYVFDGVLGAAVASLQKGRPQVTLQLDINYYRRALGARITSEARVTHAGQRVAFGEADLFDDEDRLCARCRCIYRRFGKAIEPGEAG